MSSRHAVERGRYTENQAIWLFVLMLGLVTPFGIAGVQQFIDRNDRNFRATATFRCADSPDRSTPVVFADPRTGEELGRGHLGYQLPDKCEAPIDVSNVDNAAGYQVKIGKLLGAATAEQLNGGTVRVTLQ